MNKYFKEKTINLLKDLISIPSVNPSDIKDYDNQVYGEENIIEYIKEYFDNHSYKFKVDLIPVLPNRNNLMIFLGKNKEKDLLLLQTHADTVEVGGMTYPPFNPLYKNGRMFGRGSCDAKGQIVSMIIGLEMALDQSKGNLPINICLMIAVDEEHLHRGVDKLVETGFKADGAVVGEPTMLKMATALKGSIRFKIKTKGIAAHTSMPQHGQNAIYLMNKIIHTIENVIEPKLNKRNHSLCGKSTICVSLIRGGNQVNIVPDSCEIDIDRRLIPGENWEIVYELIKEDVLSQLSKNEKERVLFLPPYLIDPSMETDINEAIVLNLGKALRKNQLAYNPIGLPFGCDASKISLLEIPTVVFGPGSIKQAHSKNEFIEIDDIVKASTVYKDLILGYKESI